MGEKGAQWLVTLARLWCTGATSVPLFSHPERYLVSPKKSRFGSVFGVYLVLFGPF